KRHRLLAAVVGIVVIVIIVTWWFSAYLRGMAVALADQSRGHYEVQTFGYPPPWLGEYRRLVRERYGVDVKPVAGCVVTQDLDSYVAGYNSVSESRIRSRFGKDIFAECAQEAFATWKREHPDRQR